MQQDAAYKTHVNQIDQRLYRSMSNPTNENERSTVLTIPVVIHIMHTPEDSVPSTFTSNPTDDQIMAGLAWLNDAFRNRGPFEGGPFFTNALSHVNSLNADTEIEFCLAQTDPKGNITNGINRVSTELSNLVYDDECPNGSNADQDLCMRQLSQWDSRFYMNIWLVNSICTASGNCDVKGYSYNAGMHGHALDGPVIEANYWGTGPSEQTVSILQVGRYLNLLTTFFTPGSGLTCENGDCLNSGDRICDTPPDADASEVFCMDGSTINSCTTDADDHSALNPYTTDVEDIYENFMDGGNMECKNSFTPDQKTRMRKILLQERNSLLQSNACNLSYTNASLHRILSPARAVSFAPLVPTIRIVNTGTKTIESLTIEQVLNQTPAKQTNWTGSLLAGDSLDLDLQTISLNQQGIHQINVRLTNINANAEDFVVGDNERTKRFFFFTNEHQISSFPYCVDAEDGQLPSFWRLGNLDQKLSFDIHQTSNCEDNVENVIRYNSSGAWNDGSGLYAGALGTHDLFITPRMDLREVSQATLTFDVAYKTAGPGRDLKLRVGVIRNNGDLMSLYQKGRNDLETSQSPYNPNLIAWEPLDCSDWRTEEINLDAYVGQDIFLIFDIELESEFSQNLYLDNICLDAVLECPVPTKIPNKEGEYVADQFCTDKYGWTHYWKSADATPITSENLLLLSIKHNEDNGLVLPPGEVKILITEGYGNGGYSLGGVAPYVANELGWHVMGRCFWTNPIVQSNDSVLVRFYYDDADVSDLGHALSAGGMEEPNMIFYTLEQGLNPDPRLGHEGVLAEQFSEYRTGDQPNMRQWKWDTHGTFRSATFAVKELSSGGGGTGGDGLGSGALYPPAIKDFAGEQIGQRISLSWTTTMEWATTEFVIYESTDGVNYVPLDFMEARGYALQSSPYKLRDEDPVDGINRYFVQLKHTNGMLVTSDTIEVRFDPAKVVTVYPNPSPDFLRIALELEEPAQIEFGIYDGQWRQLVHKNWTQEGSQAQEIDIQSLTPGIYFYVVQYRGKDYRGKIIKLGH
ncbi:MAG: T9SS type A sorting domain-containing protein [Bacteroidota bacterium]